MSPQETHDHNDLAKRRRRRLTTTVAGLGLAASAIFVAPAIASAQDESTPETTTVEQTTETSEANATKDRGAHLEDALAPLVEDGTLTQQQADAVVERLQEARESSERPGRRSGPPGARLDFFDETVTDLLDVSFEELIEQLRGGATLAEVAEANGVDPQVVIDAMVSSAEERIAEAVAAGEITESEAAERLAKATEHITDRVNGELEKGPRSGFGPRHLDSEGN